MIPPNCALIIILLALSLSRVDCFTNNAVNSSNVRPQISRGNSFSGSPNATLDDYVSYMWPLNVYLDFSPAIPSQLYGQYVCHSSVGNYVRNYIHDSKCTDAVLYSLQTACCKSCVLLSDNTNIELPEGTSYRLPVYDPLTIPLYFGSYPRVDLSLSSIDIQLVDDTGAGVELEPLYERINAFHVNIVYSMIQPTLSGNFEIWIRSGNVLIARQPINIEVSGKHLSDDQLE